MHEKPLVIGSTLAAFVASLCCLGPLLLGGFGLGAVLVSTFAPLRPYFLALSLGLLALGFFFVYRKPQTTDACESGACAPEGRARWMAKLFLWFATLAVAALAFFPSYGGKLVGTPTAVAPVAQTALETLELRISGMTCGTCALAVRSRLLETPGVAQAGVDYPSARATVKYDPVETNPSKLIQAVNATGFRASLIAKAE